MNARLRPADERAAVEEQLARLESQRSDSTFHVANTLKELTGLESRITILGYLLRGGVPSAGDRVLATQLGTAAADFLARGQFSVMISERHGRVEAVPLEEVGSRNKPIPPDHPWIESARRIGVNLGD